MSDSPTPTKARGPKDPRQVLVQTTLRLPWGYLQQLNETAARRHVSLNQMVLDALKIIHPEEAE